MPELAKYLSQTRKGQLDEEAKNNPAKTAMEEEPSSVYDQLDGNALKPAIALN